MKKIKLIVALVCFGILLLASGASADPVAVGDTIFLFDGRGSTSGGEFIVKKEISDNVPSGELFRSFCLEYNEHVKLSTTSDLYEFTISSITDYAANGGVGGQTPGTNQDPLDPRTAFLYYNYRMGLLDDISAFTYTSAGADALQHAMWNIEDEGDDPNYLVTLANNAVNGINGGVPTWSGLGPVRVMNIVWGEQYTTGSGTTYNIGDPAQSQLTIVPEPATMLLLGLGLLGVAAIRRKL